MKRLANYQPKPSTAPPPRAKAAGAAEEAAVLVTAISENVIAGTDCGFAQSYNIVRCHPSVQWAKLESLVEGARLASKDLWGD